MSDDRFDPENNPPPPPRSPFKPPEKKPYYVTAEEFEEQANRFAPKAKPKKKQEPTPASSEPLPEGHFGTDEEDTPP